METLGKGMTGKQERPVRVVQFGEGNFLRAFVDYMIDIANEQGKFDGDIVLVKCDAPPQSESLFTKLWKKLTG